MLRWSLEQQLRQLQRRLPAKLASSTVKQQPTLVLWRLLQLAPCDLLLLLLVVVVVVVLVLLLVALRQQDQAATAAAAHSLGSSSSSCHLQGTCEVLTLAVCRWPMCGGRCCLLEGCDAVHQSCLVV